MNKKQQPFFNPELSGFCSQMAMILHSGISPLEGITIMLEDSTSEQEKEILQKILDTLMETADFSLSLKETGLFPSYLVHMVQIGEETGTLDEVMSALGEHYEREDSIAKSIRNAVTYPMIMIGMMLMVILVLLVKVMPIFLRGLYYQESTGKHTIGTMRGSVEDPETLGVALAKKLIREAEG